jgi:hypothetical protein
MKDLNRAGPYTPDIITMGEAMVEFNQTHASQPKYLQGFGGDTSNMAIAASRLGARTSFITRTSSRGLVMTNSAACCGMASKSSRSHRPHQFTGSAAHLEQLAPLVVRARPDKNVSVSIRRFQ